MVFYKVIRLLICTEPKHSICIFCNRIAFIIISSAKTTKIKEGISKMWFSVAIVSQHFCYMELAFFQNQLAEFIILHIIAFCEGLMVVKGGVKVNYTRKLNHFFVFFLPFIIKVYIFNICFLKYFCTITRSIMSNLSWWRRIYNWNI